MQCDRTKRGRPPAQPGMGTLYSDGVIRLALSDIAAAGLDVAQPVEVVARPASRTITIMQTRHGRLRLRRAGVRSVKLSVSRALTLILRSRPLSSARPAWTVSVTPAAGRLVLRLAS